MKRIFTLLLLFTAMCSSAQDLSVLYKIRNEATRNSGVEKFSYQIIDLAGPRLTSSDGMERGYTIALKQMQQIGLTNSRQQFARNFSRGGWNNLKTYAAMTAPYYIHMFPTVIGWTGSTNGMVKAPVVLLEQLDSATMVQKYRGKLAGKIVLMPSTRSYVMNFDTPSATRRSEANLEELQRFPIVGAPTAASTRRPQGSTFSPIAFVRSENPIAVINANGDFNNPGISFYNHKEGAKPIAPELNITMEVHGLMSRLLAAGEKVEMELDVQNQFVSNRPIYNIVGEIQGSDLKDEIVLIGAHLDSYHHSGGAGDDAAGCITMLEAMRILKAIGVQPRRTIRIALWGGEEMGLHGSAGYVEQFVRNPRTGEKLAEHEKISMYLNSDYGPGRFRGIYTQGNIMANPIFTKWLAPLAELECSTVSNRSVGSTDHVSFDGAGIPAFQFITDDLEWGRGSHRATDFAERMNMNDLRQNAVVVAWLAYLAAMDDNKMPRK